MGKDGNIPLKNELVVMKNRLVEEMSKQKAKEKGDVSTLIRNHLKNGDFQSAI
jgi:hypothetical protein